MEKLVQHSNEEKLFALLSYISILFLIPLLVKKDNVWIQQHAKQGLSFFILELLTWIPLLGWIWGIFMFVIWIIVIVKVLTGAPYWKMPIVGDLANKIHI